jgi:UDP-2,4-diacetamido-2,4,6-trideoxy-beta-L-altropyranose hydrolase
MQIVFRTDASLYMGSGHVMRCLTLADALTAQGAQCSFISRAHPGHLLDLIRQRGYEVNELLAHTNQASDAIKINYLSELTTKPEPVHAAWLGCNWLTDALTTAAVLAHIQPDWLVVDHYALDHRWESVLKPLCKKLMVIDDLADRVHCCDLLLDQNLGRQPQDYAGLVPVECQICIGPNFALLRPEFASLRSYSLQRRQVTPVLQQLLINMGGVDQPNATGQVLQALMTCALPAECRITVVMGQTAPWLEQVRQLAAQMPWPTEVAVNVSDMAQRMADSDLAIGAAGGTAWERCCLGLPALVVVLAKNQQAGALALVAASAAQLVGAVDEIAVQLPLLMHALVETGDWVRMGCLASDITAGAGVEKVLKMMNVSYA